MSGSSNPHSIEPVRPVDPRTRRVLRLIHHAATASGARCFVAGATARDLMLVHAFGMRAGRATRDIDFGIAVESWAHFDALKNRLIESGEFGAAPVSSQRLVWKPSPDAAGTPVDIIPFDGVASQTQTVAWPPRGDVVMNVAGFAEALESSALLKVDADLAIRVASIPGLAVLKLIAWKDRRHENTKDATDLHMLLVAYAGAGNEDRIYGQELDLLEAAGFDLELAGCELLGRDSVRICHQETRRQIRDILSSKQLTEQLIWQMYQAGVRDEPRAARMEELLARFCAGFFA